MRRSILASSLLLLPVLAGCGSDPVTPAPSNDPKEIAYPAYGSTSAASGKGSFRFGAASAATQIEDKNPTTDWWIWSSPKPDGFGKGTPVGDASKGYTLALEDIDLQRATLDGKGGNDLRSIRGACQPLPTKPDGSYRDGRQAKPSNGFSLFHHSPFGFSFFNTSTHEPSFSMKRTPMSRHSCRRTRL